MLSPETALEALSYTKTRILPTSGSLPALITSQSLAQLSLHRQNTDRPGLEIADPHPPMARVFLITVRLTNRPEHAGTSLALRRGPAFALYTVCLASSCEVPGQHCGSARPL